MHGHDLNKLSGTVRYPKAAEPSSVSRMRETRTYGLKGGWGNGHAQAPAHLTTNGRGKRG
jgi:hypothetical protein